MLKLHKEHYLPLLQIGIPIMIGQVAIVIISFVDNIMVGRHALDELAAAGFVNNLLNLIVVMGLGFSYGLTPIVAEAAKQKDLPRAGAALRNSMHLNMLFALVFGIIALLLPYIPFIFNIEERLRPIALSYYYIQVGGFVATMIFNGFKQFFDGLSRTLLPMMMTIIGVLSNIFLNWCLIYGNWGFPEWGLDGAGYATLISRILMVLLLGGFFLWDKKLKEERLGFGLQRWSSTLVRELLHLGTPVSIQLGLETFSFTIAVIYAAKLGGMALAAHQVVIVITVIGFLMYYGLGSAAAIRVSHYRATQDYHEVRNVGQASHQIGFAMAVVAMLIIFGIRNRASLWFNDDAALIPFVALSLYPVVLYQMGDMLQIVYANALRGLGRVRMLVPISILCHVIVGPGLAYLFAFFLVPKDPQIQLLAIWSAFPISLTLMGVLLYRDFHKEIRRRLSPLNTTPKNQ